MKKCLRKKCAKCGKIKDTTFFYRIYKNKEVYHSYCKKCSLLLHKEYQRKNKKKISERWKKWYKKNKKKMYEYHKERKKKKNKISADIFWKAHAEKMVKYNKHYEEI